MCFWFILSHSFVHPFVSSFIHSVNTDLARHSVRSNSVYDNEGMVLDDDDSGDVSDADLDIPSVHGVAYKVSFNPPHNHVIFDCSDSSSPFHR